MFYMAGMGAYMDQLRAAVASGYADFTLLGPVLAG
jgi:hypothetical protein